MFVWLIMVDITNIDCGEGDQVIIFGNQQDILHMASEVETISYEILAAISQRIKERSFLRISVETKSPLCKNPWGFLHEASDQYWGLLQFVNLGNGL